MSFLCLLVRSVRYLLLYTRYTLSQISTAVRTLHSQSDIYCCTHVTQSVRYVLLCAARYTVSHISTAVRTLHNQSDIYYCTHATQSVTCTYCCTHVTHFLAVVSSYTTSQIAH
jgi:outer membrane murein-binding lipoprotein Lpp